MDKTWKLLKANPHFFQRYFIKEYLIKGCRKFFESKNYHELESPILVGALPQERYLDVVSVDLEFKNQEKKTVYLTPTTETFNKKILAAGLGEHFVITKVVRGLEQVSPNHSPEFTMLEWYHLNATYEDLMTDFEDLMKYCINEMQTSLEKEQKLGRFPINLNFSENYVVTYQKQKIDFSGKYHRLSIPDALKTMCGLNLEEIQDVEVFRSKLKDKGYNVNGKEDWQTLYEWLFGQEIEPNIPLDKPVFVYDYPKQICVLTKVKESNPLVCERVEIYVAGKEVGNGYTELIDWEYQKQKFEEENKARKEMGMKDVKVDWDLIEAIKSGMPNVSGIGVGLDRVAMILANAANISEINYFPVAESL